MTSPTNDPTNDSTTANNTDGLLHKATLPANRPSLLPYRHAEEARRTAVFRVTDRESIAICFHALDLTKLDSKASERTYTAMALKARNVESIYKGVSGSVAALCIPPEHLKRVNHLTNESSIRLVTVAGGFPSSTGEREKKIDEIHKALLLGAEEIDIMFPFERLLHGDRKGAERELKEMITAVQGGGATCKVILETAALETLTNIRVASRIALAMGADFLKTSSGKHQLGGATLEAVAVMAEEIRSHFERTGRKVGIKPSGGIRTPKDAVSYLCLVEQLLGKEWTTPDLFRIGASGVADALLESLLPEDQRGGDFSYFRGEEEY